MEQLKTVYLYHLKGFMGQEYRQRLRLNPLGKVSLVYKLGDGWAAFLPGAYFSSKILCLLPHFS